MPDVMGALASQDEYDVPLEQSTGVGWANRIAERLPDTWPARLANDAIGAVLAPGRALQSDTPVTSEQMIKPAADLAGLVTGGSYAAPAMEDAAGMGIRAYHSSPHDFDKFDLSKIGTGEGAQVYGHGLYFAENPAVSGQGGQYWQQFKSRFEGPEGHAAKALEAAKFDRGAAIDLIDKAIKRQADVGSPPEARWMQDAAQARKLLESDKPVGPRTYEVDINADPAHFLDWDKPLAQQQHLVDPLREAGVSRSLLNEASGGDLYEKAAIDFHRPGLGHLDRALASEKFAEAGIPGIKYLDQGSRLAGDWHLTPPDQTVRGKWMVKNRDYNSKGLHFDTEEAARAALAEKLAQQTSNYAVFNPGIIDIRKKFGLAGATTGAMGALAAQDQYRE